MSFLERLIETPQGRATLKRGFYIVLGLILVAEIVLPLVFHGEGHGEEGHFAFESWPAFGSVYGFISCVAIIIISKLIGKAFLMRDEDYYDR